MITLFLFLTSLFAREIIVDLGENKYEITNATFYETSVDAADPKNGFLNHPFYKKYVDFIKTTTPEYISDLRSKPKIPSPREKFDNCIRDKLKIRFESKVGKRNLPFNSLEASTMACHAQQFPNFSVVKSSLENEKEVIIARGKNTVFLEGALLAAQDIKVLKELKEALKPEPFGKKSCLTSFDPNNSNCSSYLSSCVNEDERNGDTDECKNKTCEKLGLQNHIYLNRVYDMSFEDLPRHLQQALNMPADQANKIASIHAKHDEGTPLTEDDKRLNCIQCPTGSLPNESKNDCIDRNGCSMLNEIYIPEHKGCYPKSCKNNQAVEEVHGTPCPKGCKKACSKRLANLNRVFNFLNKPQTAEDLRLSVAFVLEVFGDSGSLRSSDTINYSLFQQATNSQITQMASEFKTLIKDKISVYNKELELCTASTQNSCPSIDAEVLNIIDRVLKSKCKPTETFSSLPRIDKCVNKACQKCLDKMAQVLPMNPKEIYLDFRYSLFGCGEQVYQTAIKNYIDALYNSFREEVKKCDKGLPFDCNASAQILPGSLLGFMNDMGYQCHTIQSPDRSIKKTSGKK